MRVLACRLLGHLISWKMFSKNDKQPSVCYSQTEVPDNFQQVTQTKQQISFKSPKNTKGYWPNLLSNRQNVNFKQPRRQAEEAMQRTFWKKKQKKTTPNNPSFLTSFTETEREKPFLLGENGVVRLLRATQTWTESQAGPLLRRYILQSAIALQIPHFLFMEVDRRSNQ